MQEFDTITVTFPLMAELIKKSALRLVRLLILIQ